MLYTVAKLSEQNSMLASMGDLHVSPTSIRLSFTPPPLGGCNEESDFFLVRVSLQNGELQKIKRKKKTTMPIGWVVDHKKRGEGDLRYTV